MSFEKVPNLTEPQEVQARAVKSGHNVYTTDGETYLGCVLWMQDDLYGENVTFTMRSEEWNNQDYHKFAMSDKVKIAQTVWRHD